MYDYLIVGSGLFGAVFAYEAKKRGKKVLVIEKRSESGGNIACDEKDGILIHKYGPHIFHTDNDRIWQYVNRFAEFNNYINSPLACYRGELYNLPFNMNTFNKLWGVKTPAEAMAKLVSQRRHYAQGPRNLEEQALSLVGNDIYTHFIKGYTEKQWGCACSELPAFIINRLPLRFTYDNNYFNDRYQGIPIGGYNGLLAGLLEGIEIKLGVDYNADGRVFKDRAAKVVYTGAIDAYFDYTLGALEYRSLRFETERLEQENYQGVAIINYTEKEIPYTRVVEHKHFAFGRQQVTYVTKEYPVTWQPGGEAYYPVNTPSNQSLFKKYQALAAREATTIFGGRLAEYKYYDMDKVIESALLAVNKEFENNCVIN